jgi:hypothetical protein
LQPKFQPIWSPTQGGRWANHPLLGFHSKNCFFSRKRTDTESRYSTFECELLAAQAAIKHFHHFCKGRLFQLWTDHKPHVTALSRVSTPISPRQQRHLAFISEFNVQLLYLPGLKIVVADFFSGTVGELNKHEEAGRAAEGKYGVGEAAAVQANCIWLISRATVTLNFLKKSMPRMGPATAACNKLDVKSLPRNCTVFLMKPQEGMVCPSAPLSRGPDGLEFWFQGTMLKVAQCQPNTCHLLVRL